jgi:pseudouridine kinase
MSNKASITVFGAANVDITGYAKAPLVYKDANIGQMQTTAGGVGRNIAENLTYLEFPVELISVFGDDPLSRFLMDDCNNKGLNINRSLFQKNQTAATFLAILDHQNDLALGISAMSLYDDLDPDVFTKHLPKQLPSTYTVLETNFKEDILKAITRKYPDQKFVLDTVSGAKALRCKRILDRLYILKTNLLEAEMMSGLSVQSPDDLNKLVQYFLDKGVQKVFITLGSQGVIYGDSQTIDQKPPIPTKVVNTIGAGDAFVSGLVYADSLHKSIDEMASYGMAAAALTVSHHQAVNTNLNPTLLENKLHE